MRGVEAGAIVAVYDAASQAGGRCRSYFDQTLGMMIDNGNHLLLSGNHGEVDRWRRQQALRRTLERRPDLLAEALNRVPGVHMVDLGNEQRQVFAARRRVLGPLLLPAPRVTLRKQAATLGE